MRSNPLPRTAGQRVLGGRRKLCTNCQSWLDVSQFPPNHRVATGLSTSCRDCHAEANRRWRAENPDYGARYRAKRRAEKTAA